MAPQRNQRAVGRRRVWYGKDPRLMDHILGAIVPPFIVGQHSGSGPMNWKTFDLNLLVIFDTVMEARSLTKAARRLGMSQPAVSHALARLRYMLKDELFVRSPEGMNPTPRAQRIAEPVRAALRELQVTLEADEFVAADSSREFTIAANNYAARAVVPALVHRIASLAPSVVLDVRPIGLRNVLDQLEDGAVELALATLVEGSDLFKCVGLLEDEYVAALATDHPEAARPDLSIERFAAWPHIGITSGGDDAHFVDDALSERGLARLVSVKAPLHSVVSILIGSQAVAVLPRRVAEDLATHCPLAVRALPFPSPRITLSMIWHRRLDNHPAHRWLRDGVRSLLAKAPLRPA
jgi:DNA-binding transcriptional LysR family regulator